MANPNKKRRAELAVFTKTTAAAFADGRASSLLPEQSLAFATALAAEADALSNEEKKLVELLAAAQAQLLRAQERRLKILKIMTASKLAMRAAGSKPAEYEAVGYDPPAGTRTRVKPKAPSRLTATGFSNGTNKLKWKNNNVSGRVVFVIEANKGGGDGWSMIGSTRKQTFVHSGVTPGQGYFYRVRAEATRGQVSAWSNQGMVYQPKSK
jgi:hypothetical protein